VIVQSWVEGGFGSESFGQMRGVATRANLQPAVAVYVRRPEEPQFKLFAMDVLRIVDGRIADITTFSGPLLVRAFDLPQTL
jgi:RNA polymerase sigma-70 factor (ECF subfamily)